MKKKASWMFSPAVPVIGVGLVIVGVAGQVADANQSGSWVWSVGVIIAVFLTNLFWAGAVVARKSEAIDFLGMLPWGMNFVLAGAAGMVCLNEVVRLPLREPAFVVGMGVLLVVLAAVAGWWVRRMTPWTILGTVCAAGSVLGVAGVIFLVVGMSAVGGSARGAVGYLVSAFFAFVPGALMVIPMVWGAFMLHSQKKTDVMVVELGNGACKRCGYDLRATIDAGGKVCPECGLFIVWQGGGGGVKSELRVES